MALTDGSLIMSGSTGGFSVKSVSSEAEIKTNGGDTTLTLGTTSSFSYVSASAFKGDGSQLTNLPASDPFPYTASSAAIISRSFASGDTDSTALRLFGSGSVSESGIFEVEGSAGPLFSVADGLDGILMEVNNISGLPLFQVSSSNEVFVNRGNLTSGVTTATASFAYFTGSFQGDGSGLTGLPAASAGSTSGRVVFTTTNGALTTDSGFDYDSTTNQLTVENLNVTHLTSSFITSSTIETSGSNIFGDDTTDTQTLIGTTIMTGSAEITGSLKVTGSADFSNATVTGITVSTPTLDEVTSAGNVTSNAITAGTISGSAFKLNNANALSHTGNVLYVGNANDWTTVELGRQTTDEIHVNGLLKAEQLLRAEQSAHITGSLIVTGSAEFRGDEGYASNVVIGQNASATSQNTVVIGKDAGISFGGQRNVAIGESANLSNNTSFGIVVGYGTDVTGTNGVAIGYLAQAAGNGISLGRSAEAASNAIAIGKGITANASQLEIGFENPTISASLSTGRVILSGSTGGLELIGSGSTMFEVIGSEGTLFSVDDDLDGVIFTANDRTGLPVLEASASGEVYIGKAPQSLYTTAVISSNNANVTQSIYGLDTSSYGGAFFEYTAHSGSNARAGNIMAVWNPSDENLDVDMSFNETTTLDIGNTENLVMKVHVSQSQAQLAAFSTTAGYNIKTIIKSI